MSAVAVGYKRHGQAGRSHGVLARGRAGALPSARLKAQRNTAAASWRGVRMQALMSRSAHAVELENVPTLMRPSEVAALLGVSRTWLYDAPKEGRSPCVRLGGPDGPLRFVPDDLCAWIEDSRATWRPARRPRASE
jgi:excisionase family DNA binding protein